MRLRVSSLIVALLLLTAPCFAQDKPRAIDFTSALKGIDGKPIPNGGARETTGFVTLSDVFVSAVNTTIPDDQHMLPLDKFKLGMLAEKVYQNKAAVLSAEEIASIKDRIGKVYGPGMVTAAWQILDPVQK